MYIVYAKSCKTCMSRLGLLPCFWTIKYVLKTTNIEVKYCNENHILSIFTLNQISSLISFNPYMTGLLYFRNIKFKISIEIYRSIIKCPDVWKRESKAQFA